VVTMNLEIGLISPPVGFNIYVGSSLSKLPLYEVMKSTLPILFIMLCALLLITYVPWISLVIPKLFFG
jgi:C4-dicarboxylate transporter DctM subunit